MAKKIWLGILLVSIAGLLWAWLAGPQWLEEWNRESQQEQLAFQQKALLWEAVLISRAVLKLRWHLSISVRIQNISAP
ncbi:hypothetical protein [Aliamphritea spongicola]|nr:hypothetical protein [Aliamphritea spongicola]